MTCSLCLKAGQLSLVQLKRAEADVVLLKNTSPKIPLENLDKIQIRTISVGKKAANEFSSTLANYMDVDTIGFRDAARYPTDPTANLQPVYVVAIYKEQLSVEEQTFLKNCRKELIVCAFANPAQWLKSISKSSSLIVAPDSSIACERVAAEIIFGGIAASGKLQKTIRGFPKGFGLTTEQTRFKYTFPEDAGIDGAKLTLRIDSLASNAIRQQIFPGCVVLVAKDRKIIFNKAYGYHTYLKAEGKQYEADVLNRKTEAEDLFDLASVTKVAAGCLAYLKLVDEGKIKLDEKFSAYFPLLKGSNKANITVKELLCHVGGLQAYSSFYKAWINPDGNFNPDFIRSTPSEEFPVKISPILYVRKDIDEYIYNAIAASPLLPSYPQHKYVYSDWPFVMTPKVVETIEHQPFEDFLQTTFYRSLGASEMMYNPCGKIPLARIVPTELDNYFRHTQLHGYVHDETSGIMGGHSANAGLFAKANDLAKLMQLYLQKGTYGGKRYFSEKTFDLFNSCPFESDGVRRGICFDKPDVKEGKVVGHSYCSELASPESFGHSGYTGTVVWVDPTCNLIYIFLSNRVYPTRNNTKIVSSKIRAKIQTAIYESLIEKGDQESL